MARWTAVAGVACVVALGCLKPSLATAHSGQPPDISSWGGFDPTTVRCQQVIGSALQRCFERVLVAQRRCMDEQLAGQTCDESTRDSRIRRAEQAGQDQLAEACTDLQLQQLHFIGLDDAKSDLTRACGDQADAAISLLYGPAVATGSAAGVDEPMSQCLRQTAALSTKLLRFALKLKSRTLDHMARRDLTANQKQALMERVHRRVTSLRVQIADLIAAACPSFSNTYQTGTAGFLDLLEPRGDCLVGSGYVQSAVTCPQPVCGNGVKETGEQCDDGNAIDDDLCHDNCTKNDCAVFPSTYALIQSAIFERHGCTNALCHGAEPQQYNLDLREGRSYDDLFGVPSVNDPELKRVEPGDPSRSLLWLKLAAATLQRSGVPGSPMPLGLAPLNANELEAVHLWIHAAAPRTGVVAGAAQLLDACALPADPIQIAPPPPPARGTGVQLHMPAWEPPPQSEDEVCFATYYDVSDQVAPQFQGTGDTLRFRRQVIVQDPQSHHLIVNLYRGEADIDDPVWGPFTCKGGQLDGQSCDPKDMNSCGTAGACGSVPTSSVACIGFGPADSQTTGTNGFTGTQQTAYQQTFAEGVYEELPMRGIIIWNSHAFNLTRTKAKQEAWLNFYFAARPEDQLYPVRGIFDASDIFVQNVPPFQTREYCNHHILDDGAQLFELSSHMHKRGKRFRIFRGSFSCRGGSKDGGACSPMSPEMCPGTGAVCVEAAGRDPEESLTYSSTIYNDPVVVHFDPPLSLTGAEADRTFTYCALYDNGATDTDQVKKKSTSPPTPLNFPFGGPCDVPSGCTKGNVRQTCKGSTQAKRDASCDTELNKGDGACDACPLKGGVTTEDEMFILLGSYYLPK